MKEYLSTSEIAKLFKLNRQTLHFYDKKGLFKPEYRDSENGYRKYSFEQISNLALIRYLGKIGFSLGEIKEMMELENIHSMIEKFKRQSETLKSQLDEILKTNDVVQRKIYFVEKKLKEIEIGETEIKWISPIEYVFLGQEGELYMNEAFYFSPTIAFYHFDKTAVEYERVFGAYIEPGVSVSEEVQKDIKQVDAQKCLYFLHQGPYMDIPSQVTAIAGQYKNLKLSANFFCINIVDQFLESNVDKFITEIMIPIL